MLPAVTQLNQDVIVSEACFQDEAVHVLEVLQPQRCQEHARCEARWLYAAARLRQGRAAIARLHLHRLLLCRLADRIATAVISSRLWRRHCDTTLRHLGQRAGSHQKRMRRWSTAVMFGVRCAV